MKSIAIIPARGGSKRLPRKNLIELGGKPLVAHTIEAAIGSGKFSRIILSSDDDEILSIGDSYQEVTTEKRDAGLAGDKVKVIDLIKQIGARADVESEYDIISLLLPTCPFRTADDLVKGFNMLTEDDYSVVSMCPMNEPVQLVVGLDESTGVVNKEALLDPSPLVTGQTRSQDFQPYFRVNGGFYIAWLKKFNQSENFFQGKVKGCVMDAERSIDIDYEKDLEVARFLIEKGYINLT
ncbi:MAG: acylneuraminate cytidylyltransferase family protein [Verrucomicrobiales bacterium]|nr:acylneuraminate cytidylyltransferase family protein [Verrucomicrobiales bacterium]